MTTFLAQIEAFNEKVERNMDLVVRGAIQDVSELMTVAKYGVVRGEPFETGVVPVDQGQLIGSVIVDIGGGLAATGSAAAKSPPDYTTALAGMELGETVTVAFTAPYARVIEYGRGSAPGRFFVRNAVQQWQTIVEQNAALFGD